MSDGLDQPRLRLGPDPDEERREDVTEVEPESGALFARNAFNPEFGSAVAFADTSLRPRTVTGDRTEFIGRNRSMARPSALGLVAM